MSALAAARECVQQFDRNPDPSLHHQLSVLCLAPGSPFREQVDAFIEGVALADLAEEFLLWLLPLLYVPCVERIIESRHALITCRLFGKKEKAESRNYVVGLRAADGIHLSCGSGSNSHEESGHLL